MTQVGVLPGQIALWERFLVSAADLQQVREARRQQVGELRAAPKDVLSFRVASERFAIPVADIKEVVALLPIASVPRPRPSLVGLMPLRGELIPIFCAHFLLGLQKPPRPGTEVRILILGKWPDLAGLAVDAVEEVIRIDTTALEPRPHGVLRRVQQAVLGLYSDGDHQLIVLAAEPILAALEAVL